MSFRIMFTEITIDADPEVVGYSRISFPMELTVELDNTFTEEKPYLYKKDFYFPTGFSHINRHGRLELRLYVDFSSGTIHTKTKLLAIATGKESTVFKVNEIMTVATYTAVGGDHG